MGTINRKRPDRDTKVRADSHQNFMAGPSYDLNDPILRLRCMAASCFFGEPQYYKSDDARAKSVTPAVNGKALFLSEAAVRSLAASLDEVVPREWRTLTPKQALEKAIDEALAHDPEATLRIAAELRHADHIRVTPQVIAVRAANHAKVKGPKPVKGSGNLTPQSPVTKYNGRIMDRADEPATQMAYQLEAFGRPIPNSLKRSWEKYLESVPAKQLAKYRLDSRSVKTVDVVNMSHPSGEHVDKLVKGELKLGARGEGGAGDTWESIRSNGGSWEQAVEVMGHMALLRNLRNLVEAKVDTKLWLDKFVETARGGKQLPFRYVSAYYALKESAAARTKGKVLDAVENALIESMENLPTLPGKSLVLSDNSGSARTAMTSSLGTMKISTIGNLMGVITGMASEEGEVGVFGNRLETFSVRKRSSVFDQLEKAERLGEGVGVETEHGIWLALERMTKNREHVDNLFVYSDMQAGHGGMYGFGGYPVFRFPDHRLATHQCIDVPQLIREYRAKVNPRLNVFLVQIAGYEDVLVPEFYNRTFILGGWSDSVIKFARRMIDVFNGQEAFRAA